MAYYYSDYNHYRCQTAAKEWNSAFQNSHNYIQVIIFNDQLLSDTMLCKMFGNSLSGCEAAEVKLGSTS